MVTEREQELLEENARLRAEVALLRQKVDLLVKRIFGAGSEKLDPRQLELLLEGSSPGKANEPDLAAEATRRSKEESTPRSKSKPAKNKWPRLPAHLPCVEELVDPLPVQAEPQAWRCIAAPGLLAQVIVAKYCDHLPLHRQERIYATRHQVILPRQTLARWMGLAADWLGLIYREINAGVVKGGYIQMDETPVRYLDPGNKKTGTGYLWVCNRPGGEVVYHWRTSRAAECVGEILPAHWRGVLQCDGYAGYRSYARSAGREGHIRLAACYAHARRKFIESQSQAPCIVTWLLRQMAHLYQIEKYLRKERAGPRLREALRAAQSRPIHERIRKALVRLKTKKRYLPKSSMGKAIDYALGQWPGLSVFLQDGRVEIDNNLVENAIRPTAVGKKNWLFVGDADAGQRGAVLYTVIENCRRNGVDPYAYLREILTKLPVLTNQNIATWIPAAYAKRLREERYPQAAAS
ncbi:MAG: IS66 family transposase [Chthoniobacteraceae bacterium]